MLTLGINTSTEQESIALLESKKRLGEKTWRGDRDEIKKLLPGIAELIARAGRTLDDISRIVIVRGPGPYGALRIGVTTANILGLALNAKLFEIETEAL